MSGSTALVTGATGFVGSHLVRRLVNQGWQVHLIVRPNSDLTLLQDVRERIVVHIYNDSTESLVEIVKVAQPDVVFHLASLFLAEHQTKDVVVLIQSNVLFGTQLVEAMALAGVNRLVNTGTSWQHYDGQNYNPVNLYAATKQAFEEILQFYVEARRLQVITLKLFDTYGSDDPRPKLLSLLKRIAKEQQPLAMSPGEQFIDLVHVDDVARAFELAAERLLSMGVVEHERYAVSSGSPVQLRELVRKIEQALGTKLPITWGERPYRSREVMRPWEGQWLPGWQPSVFFRGYVGPNPV